MQEQSSRRPGSAWLILVAVVAIAAGAAAGAIVNILLDSGSSLPSPAFSAGTGSRPSLDGSSNVAEVAAFAIPGVVTVVNEQPVRQDSQGRLIESVSVGSGVILDDRGFIVTNEHVIRDMGKLKVVLNDGEERDATLVSHDAPFTDLAVLRVRPGGLTALSLGDSQALQLGEPVVAVGSALFEYRNSVSSGIVSGLGRRWLREGVYVEDLIQTDAAINSGNSGGPLLNMKGEVVGLNASVVRRLGSADTVFGVSFAISSRTMAPVVQSMIERGQFARPYFGVEHQDINDEFLATQTSPLDHGALVLRVISGGPADKAGLRAGDILLRVGKTEIDADDTFLNALSRLAPNERATVELWRAGRTLEVTVEVTPR